MRQMWQRAIDWVRWQSAPQIVEGLMLVLAIALCGGWLLLHGWQYLVLSLSYTVGAIASILAREFISPSPATRLVRIASVGSLLLLILIGLAVVEAWV